MTPPKRDSLISTIRRGIAITPELTNGLIYTALMGLVVAIGQITVPVIIQAAIDDGSLSEDSTATGSGLSVLQMVGVGTMVVVASSAIAVTANLQMVKRAERSIARLRVTAFDHVHRLPMIDQSEARTGILISRVTSDVDALSRFADWGMFVWLVNPVVIFGIIVAMAFYSWVMALMTVLLLSPIVPLIRWTQDSMAAAHDGRRTATSELISAFNESLAGAAIVRIHGLQSVTRRRLGRSIQDRYEAGLRANAYQATVYILGDVFTAFTMVAILIAGVAWGDELGLSAGQTVGLLLLAKLMNSPLAELAETWSHSQEAVAGWRKVLGLLDQPAGNLDPDEGQDLEAGPLSVSFDAVSFRYAEHDPTDGLVLDQVTIDLPERTTIAVVGASGSGKSTFCKLMCRLADPTAGSISLGGVPLTDINAAARHRAVRFVPQDGFLFEGSVLDNLAMGIGPGVAPDADTLTGVIERLGLESWVAQLDNGLHTEVGEQGQNLSVGERQLVGLARAAVADPGLLILDEATSSLDPQTERQLSEAVTRLASDRTLVTIAHRLSTAEAADLILVFDAGHLVESGSHSELVDLGGTYAALYDAWEREQHTDSVS